MFLQKCCKDWVHKNKIQYKNNLFDSVAILRYMHGNPFPTQVGSHAKQIKEAEHTQKVAEPKMICFYGKVAQFKKM